MFDNLFGGVTRFFNELPSQTLAKRGEVFQKIVLT